MAQITINIQTLDWTMGETVGLHFNPLLEFIDFREIRNVKLDFSANFGDDKIKGVPCLER